MSSLVRRIQKRIARDQGYHRSRDDGMIHNSDGDVIGPHWPQVKAFTKPCKVAHVVDQDYENAVFMEG